MHGIILIEITGSTLCASKEKQLQELTSCEMWKSYYGLVVQYSGFWNLPDKTHKLFLGSNAQLCDQRWSADHLSFLFKFVTTLACAKIQKTGFRP